MRTTVEPRRSVLVSKDGVVQVSDVDDTINTYIEADLLNVQVDAIAMNEVTSATLTHWYDCEQESYNNSDNVDVLTDWGSGAIDLISSGSLRPQFKKALSSGGGDGVEFDGSEYLYHDDSLPAAELNFMHNGTGGTIVLVLEILGGTDDAVGYIYDNRDKNSSNRGIGLTYDDRSSESRVDTILCHVGTNTGGGPCIVGNSSDNILPINTVHVVVFKYKDDGGNNDGEVWVANSRVINEAKVEDPSTDNAENILTVGAESGASKSFYLNFRLYEMGIFTGVVDNAEIQTLTNGLTEKWI